MTAALIVADVVRVNDADANTNWSNLGGGGPAPASEPQLRYQYSGTGSVGAVNRKVTSTASRTGVEYDPGSGARDMSTVFNKLVFLQLYVADFGDLNTTYGCEVRIGSGSGDYYSYNIAGSGANRAPYDAGYPAQGGYILAAINPNIAAWREGTTGTPDLTAVDYWGFAAQFVAGGAKSENLAADSISTGRGILAIGGTAPDPPATFVTYLEGDQDIVANRWGVVYGTAPVVNAIGLLIIGSSAVRFDDDFSTVIFRDGYHGPGDTGVWCILQNASSDIKIANTLIGLGSITTSDTRPDFLVTETTGSPGLLLSAVAKNFRKFTFTSACEVDGADLQFDTLIQATIEIQNSLLRTTGSAANVAAIDDPTFGTTSGMHDLEFIQDGIGHAIEIDTPGTYDLQDILFTGYSGTPGTNLTPSSGSSAAAILNSSGGLVTINVNGAGNQPSIRNTAVSTTVVNQTVTVTITAVDVDGDPIQGAKVFLETDPGGVDVIAYGITNASGQTSVSYGGSTPQAVTGYVRKGTAMPVYKTANVNDTISNTGLSAVITMVLDE